MFFYEKKDDLLKNAYLCGCIKYRAHACLLMLNKPYIPLIPMNLIVVRACHEPWQPMPYCVMGSIQLGRCQEQNSIELSKKSALTVSQLISINQQQRIGMTGSALA